MNLIEHLEKLRHFYRVTNYRSINEGAQAMGLSQAGLSKSITNLETVLDTRLFIRSNDGLILTNEGQMVLTATKKILAEATALESNLRSLKAIRVPDNVRVGMYDSIAVYFFDDLKSYLGLIYPEVELELVVDSSAKLLGMTNAGALDIAIGVNFRGHRHALSEFFLLFEDHFSFYQAVKTNRDGGETGLIFHPDATDAEGITTAAHLAPLLKSRLAHRVFNFETVKTLTLKGLGIGVLPTQVAKPMVSLNQLVPARIARAPNLFGKHTIGFLASSKFLKGHMDFAQDIFRLGERWAKT